MQHEITFNEMTILKNCPLFNTIPENSIGNTLKSINTQKRFYAKGEVLLWEGEPNNNLGIILSGEAIAKKSEPSGKSLIITSLYPGKIFGDVLSLSQKHKSPVTVEALAETTVLLLPIEMIIKKAAAEYDNDDRLLKNLLNTVSSKYFELHERINCIMRPSLREKILYYLYNEAGENKNSTFTISYSRQALAHYLNSDRSSLSRELSKMKKEGLIDYYHNSFKLL